MKKLVASLAIFLLGYTAIAQETQQKQPEEIYAIGTLRLYKAGKQDYASVYDSRVDVLYEFPLPNGDECGHLIEGKEYRFRLLASCDSSNCYDAVYVLVDFSKTVKQTYRDIDELTEGAAIKFETNERPKKY